MPEAARVTMKDPPAPNDAASRDAGTKSRAPARIDIKVSWCKGCGLCVDFCKRGVLEMEGALPRVVQAEKCNRCLMCEAACPDFAIDVRAPEPDAGGDGR